MNTDLNYDEKMNVIIVGDSTVGKTSLIKLYFEGLTVGNYLATTGVEQYTKNIEIGNKLVRLRIWDTAGQERFQSLTRNYYKNAQGILLLFDVSNRESFVNVKRWIESINENRINEKVKTIIIGNKVDLSREVSFEEAKKLANEHKILYYETSAKKNIGVDEAFKGIILQVLDNTMDINRDSNGNMRITTKNENITSPIKINPQDKQQSSGCKC